MKLRTLIRVVLNRPQSEYIYVVLPGWDYYTAIPLKKSDIPEALANSKADYRFYAKTNLRAGRAKDLKFSDWELPEPAFA